MRCRFRKTAKIFRLKKAKKDNKSELLKSFFKRLSGADFAPWQKKEFLNIVKQSKTDIASYDFDDLAKIFSSMDNAEITVKQ